MEKRTQELVGKVVSAKCDKTITVLVETYRKDRLYGKRVNILRNMQHMMKLMLQMLVIQFVLLRLDHYLKLSISV